MSKPDDGGPAFPRDHRHEGHNGMSLRDYFAAHATEGDVQEYIGKRKTIGGFVLNQYKDREMAKYLYADAMLEARKPKSP